MARSRICRGRAGQAARAAVTRRGGNRALLGAAAAFPGRARHLAASDEVLDGEGLEVDVDAQRHDHDLRRRAAAASRAPRLACSAPQSRERPCAGGGRSAPPPSVICKPQIVARGAAPQGLARGAQPGATRRASARAHLPVRRPVDARLAPHLRRAAPRPLSRDPSLASEEHPAARTRSGTRARRPEPRGSPGAASGTPPPRGTAK